MPGSLSRVSPSPAPGGLTSSGRGGKETVSGGDEVVGIGKRGCAQLPPPRRPRQVETRTGCGLVPDCEMISIAES
jgi:hypothetical protein